MWNPIVVSWLGEKGCVKVEHMGQHIRFGPMCDIVAKSHMNVTKGKLLKSTDYMDIICHIEHAGLLIVRLIINILPFYFQTRISYLFYALDRHHNLLVLTHWKLMTIKPQCFTSFNWN